MSVQPTAFLVDDDDRALEILTIQLTTNGLPVEAFRSPAEFLDHYRDEMPGCVVTDLRMPGGGGDGVARVLSERGFGIPVIVLTAYGTVSHSIASIKSGVFDYIEKPAEMAVVVAAVHKAFEHDRLARRRRLAEAERAALFAKLTAREREVLDLVLAGHQSKTIGYDLGISPRTVEIHRGHIMAKLGVRTLSQLIHLGLGVTADEADAAMAKLEIAGNI